MAILTRRVGWKGEKTESFEVRVLARAEGYAMVRRPGGALTFVCSEKELSPKPVLVEVGRYGPKNG